MYHVYKQGHEGHEPSLIISGSGQDKGIRQGARAQLGGLS